MLPSLPQTALNIKGQKFRHPSEKKIFFVTKYMCKLKCYFEFLRKAYVIPNLCNLLGLSKHALFKGFCIAVFGQQTCILNIGFEWFISAQN